MTETFVFILNFPTEKEYVMWPDWYENAKERLDKDFEEIPNKKLEGLRWEAFLANSNYKVFKMKNEDNKETN